MTGGRGIPRRTLPEYNEALKEAWADAQTPTPGKTPAPRLLCDGRSAEFVDYDEPPTPREAAVMCEPCPLLLVCQENARHIKPVHGIWGGEIWENRKRILVLPVQENMEPSSAETRNDGAPTNLKETLAVVD